LGLPQTIVKLVFEANVVVMKTAVVRLQ
jgi:hypothetical protein